jgi:hypothetical protein
MLTGPGPVTALRDYGVPLETNLSSSWINAPGSHVFNLPDPQLRMAGLFPARQMLMLEAPV